jgi:hypothetical protein
VAKFFVRNDEVVGSIPTSSTNLLNNIAAFAVPICMVEKLLRLLYGGRSGNLEITIANKVNSARVARVSHIVKAVEHRDNSPDTIALGNKWRIAYCLDVL